MTMTAKKLTAAKQKAVEMVENFRPFSNATIGGNFYFNVEKENAKPLLPAVRFISRKLN